MGILGLAHCSQGVHSTSCAGPYGPNWSNRWSSILLIPVQAPALDEKWNKVTQQEAARKQAGPLFEDLTSGWKQPESDNDHSLSGIMVLDGRRMGHENKVL